LYNNNIKAVNSRVQTIISLLDYAHYSQKGKSRPRYYSLPHDSISLPGADTSYYMTPWHVRSTCHFHNCYPCWPHEHQWWCKGNSGNIQMRTSLGSAQSPPLWQIQPIRGKWTTAKVSIKHSDLTM